MDRYDLGVALAVAHLAELRRQTDRWRLNRRVPGRTAGRRGKRAPGSPRVLGGNGQAADRMVAANGPRPETEQRAMLVRPQHEPCLFDPDHCQGCARQAGLLDHYWRVQQQEASLRQAHASASAASRRASVALWSSGTAILVAVVALLIS
jgi:hypothetical protein